MHDGTKQHCSYLEDRSKNLLVQALFGGLTESLPSSARQPCPPAPPCREVGELAASAASANEREKHIKAHLRRLQRREQKARSRARASWDKMITFGVMVMAMQKRVDFTWVPKLTSRFQQTVEPEQVEDAITEKFMELSAEELQRLLEPGDKRKSSQPLNQAHAFAIQYDVWHWVDDRNRNVGVAPSVAEVIHQRNLLLSEMQSHACGEFTTTTYSTEKAASYKWVANWKHDWNLAFGKASEHEVLPTDNMRTKAFNENPIARQERRRFILFKYLFHASDKATTFR